MLCHLELGIDFTHLQGVAQAQLSRHLMYGDYPSQASKLGSPRRCASAAAFCARFCTAAAVARVFFSHLQIHIYLHCTEIESYSASPQPSVTLSVALIRVSSAEIP